MRMTVRKERIPSCWRIGIGNMLAGQHEHLNEKENGDRDADDAKRGIKGRLAAAA